MQEKRHTYFSRKKEKKSRVGKGANQGEVESRANVRVFSLHHLHISRELSRELRENLKRV